MLLKNSCRNEYGEIEGTAFFPYFHKDINVVCRKGTSIEYTEKCLEYLQKADERLILQICKYAEYYLKDVVQTTSIGELYYYDEEPFPHDKLLELLQYFSFEILYIEEPPEAAYDSSEVLNLYGGCDWEEDHGIQCLVRNGKVIFLGGYNNLSIWEDYDEEYFFNYVFYEKRDEFWKMAANKAAEDNWQIKRFVRWRSKGLLAAHKLENFTDTILVSKENVTPKEATKIFENTYFFQLMHEYPKLLEESMDFWLECYCIEKEEDIGELVRFICENCEWNMF